MTMTPTEVAQIVLSDKNQGQTFGTDILRLISSVSNLEFESFVSSARFEGRLELRGNTPTIFLNLHDYDLDHPRVRFTLGHEFGHFVLHRQRLRRGQPFHDSVISLGDDLPRIEREANEFASEILLPTPLVRQFLDGKYLALPHVQTLRRAAQASWQTTAIKLATVSSDVFCFYWEQDGVIAWSAPSDSWRYRKLPWSGWKGKRIPSGSSTAQDADSFEDREVPRSIWHPNLARDASPLFESAVRTSYGRLILVIDADSDNVAY